MIRTLLGQAVDSANGRRSRERLKELRACEYLDKQKVAALQKEKLAALIRHAYAYVPYYRRTLGHSGVIDAKGRLNLDNFTRVPCLTKNILKERWEGLKSSDLEQRRWVLNRSGGSTGDPARFIQDQEYHDYVIAIKYLFDGWSGCPAGHRKALLWGSERDMGTDRPDWRVKCSRWLHNQLWLNAFKMTPKVMEDYAAALNKFKPHQILAYVESGHEFARFLQSKNISLHPPKSIMTSAGVLYPEMRAVMEEVFGAPVFNRYGSREVGDIACDCSRHEGLHVVPFTHYLEILRPDGSLADPGEEGEIAVTLLTNYAMPFIRYKIGDRAAWSSKDCSCGRAWPMLKTVAGRVTDIFLKKDGGFIPSEYFIHMIGMYNKDSIKKFQVIQEEYSIIRFKVVPADGMEASERLMHSAELKEIEEKFKLAMGEDCRIILETVEDIEPSSSGKFRSVYSLVKS